MFMLMMLMLILLVLMPMFCWIGFHLVNRFSIEFGIWAFIPDNGCLLRDFLVTKEIVRLAALGFHSNNIYQMATCYNTLIVHRKKALVQFES